jgi:hypothetical protein
VGISITVLSRPVINVFVTIAGKTGYMWFSDFNGTIKRFRFPTGRIAERVKPVRN